MVANRDRRVEFADRRRSIDPHVPLYRTRNVLPRQAVYDPVAADGAEAGLIHVDVLHRVAVRTVRRALVDDDELLGSRRPRCLDTGTAIGAVVEPRLVHRY